MKKKNPTSFHSVVTCKTLITRIRLINPVKSWKAGTVPIRSRWNPS